MDLAGTLAGFLIETELPLTGLSPVADGAAPRQICVRLGSAREIVVLAAAQPAVRRLGLPHVGDFLVLGPDEVMVAPAPGASSAQISAFLFGPCLSVIAYLNGLAPLHAAVAETAGGAVALTGASGAGKSTLAAALAQLGCRLFGDDVCFLERTDAGVVAWPGVRRLRLNHDSATALGHAQGPDRLAPGSKHNLALPAGPAGPITLEGLYVIAAAAADEAPSIEPVGGAHAAELVILNLHRGHLARQLGVWAGLMPICVGLAEQTPVYRYRRPADLTRLGETAVRLLAHAAREPFQARAS